MRLDRSLLSLVLLGTVVAVPAFAQSQALSTYPECVSAPSHEDSDAAHNAYLFGKRKFDEAEYATAVNYFKDAYKTDCSKHEILIIISRSYELAGNKPEAINALEVFLKRVPNASDADTHRKRIANLKAQAGVAAPATTVAPPPTATTATPPAATTTATATATALPTTTSTPSERRASPLPWVVVGVGGIAIVAGVVIVVTGANAIGSAKDEFKTKGCDVGKSSCVDPTTGTNLIPIAEINRINAKLSGGYRTETLGGVVIAVGAAAVAGGLVWHFLDKPGKKEGATVDVRPVATPGYAGIGVGGSF